MTAKPETLFSKRLHKRFTQPVYYEKTNNPFRGGIPDFYYEGIFPGILWAEHKFWKTVPRIITPESIVSPLQWRWIQRAHNNNVPIVTIVGYKEGGLVIYPDDKPMSGSQFKERVISLADLALWIEGQTINESKLDRRKRRIVTINHADRSTKK